MQNFYSRLIVSREITKTKAGKVFFESPFNSDCVKLIGVVVVVVIVIIEEKNHI